MTSPSLSLGDTPPLLLVLAAVATAACALVAALGEALRRSRLQARQTGEMLRVILDGIDDAIVTADTDSRVTSMNAAAELLTGWKASDAVGCRLDQVVSLVNAATRERIGSPAIGDLQEGVIVGVAQRTILLARDGREREIDDRTTQLRSNRGEPAGIVMVLRDVTEQRRLERVRDAQLRELRWLASVPDADTPLTSA